MALDFQDLQISGGGTITIPTDIAVIRLTKGSELTYAEHDATHRDAMIRNFNIVPASGNSDIITQILGGHPGSIIALRNKNVGDTITLEDGSLLHIMTGTVVLTDVHHLVLFACTGTNEYAKFI